MPKWSLEVVYYIVSRVMAHPHFPNTQMVVKVNPILKTWWKDIQKNREFEANELLGGLTALISVESDLYLIKALLNSGTLRD